MFKISCFADEISADLDVQIEVVKRNNIKHIELRSVWDKNILDLSWNELDIVKDKLEKNGINVSSIGSPIGKVSISDNLDLHFERFKKAVKIAFFLESHYIRIFSFYLKKDEISKYQNTVIDRLRQMTEFAADNNIILLHENEADIFGESSDNCLILLKSVNSSNLKATFDPSNFVVAGEEAYNQSFIKLKDYIEYIHVKDSKKGTGEIVIAGKGDGEIRSVLNSLLDRKEIFISLEPHLSLAAKYRGFTGPELFEADYEALKDILKELNASYE